jgi:mannose-6-phosphate isomerase-like protein (cupin superfamily)
MPDFDHDSAQRPFRLGAGEGHRIWAFGDLMILKATSADTDGRSFVMEQHVPRHRHAPGRHVHATDDQAWFVIAGRGRWFIGDETFVGDPGDFIHGPHGLPHAFSADTDDLHVLVITTPAGLEGFFAEVGVEANAATHPPDDLVESDEDPALAERYGVTALGPETRWTLEPKER